MKKWAVVVTTVPERRHDLLPQTLVSLKSAGFPEPRLCVDGADWKMWQEFAHLFGRGEGPQLEITARWPTIRTFGNWLLSLSEAYIRNPAAERYLVAQDDFVCYRNLRKYLEYLPYPERSYQNLYTFPSNEARVPKDANGQPRIGWYESATLNADTTDQTGRGAVALVFSRLAVQMLLQSQHMIEKPTDAHRGWRSVDGAVVTAMNKIGWREHVHFPSLVQHVGRYSAMGNKPHLQSTSFRGETFDALDLLKGVAS